MKNVVFTFIFFCSLTGYNKFSEAGGYNDSLALENCKRCMLLTDINQHRIIAVDMNNKAIIWEWKASESNIPPDKWKWFVNYSDAKPVYGKKYLLVSSSAGGVALVRISNKKTIFYAYAGGNTHSLELLPDGNIVSASSTGGFLMLFHSDTVNFPNVYKKKIYLAAAHNVVWDKKRQILWAAGTSKLYQFKYNFNCSRPDLIPVDSIKLPGTNAHDLFPVFGKDSLFLTMLNGIFIIDPATLKISPLTDPLIRNIKSISSGPENNQFPIIIMKPKMKWWSDEVLDIHGNRVFQLNSLKSYKARWFLCNQFSYNCQQPIEFCGKSVVH